MSGVHPFQLGTGGGEGIEFHQRLAEPGTPDPVEHCVQPLRPFGVTRTGQMFEIGGVGGEQHGHTE